MTDLPDTAPTAPDWWKGAVIYQVYPRSFRDLSGDGIGDLKGISAQLDYIASLSVDAIWISPFQKSPMRDYGYDISDYCEVDPLFGSLDDALDLIDAAHRRGLKVLMDQAFSHTSDKHSWFEESRRDRGNEKADWYVWTDPRPDGTPPNNWLSVFGGPSWQWDPRRDQYYLHNFLSAQPDLNMHNPAVQNALLEVCRFWLDRGVDGFRLDVCAFYFHDLALRDNPANPEPPTGDHFNFNPYSWQHHIYDIARPENLDFLERLRAVSDAFPGSVLLGELHESEGERLHRDYTANNRLHLAYGYWMLGAEDLPPQKIREIAVALGHGDDDGWPCWSLENHDFMRAPTRLGLHHDHPHATLAYIAAISAMRGSMCLYQGSELGLPQAEVPQERLLDPYGIEFFPEFKGRDGSRTPMPWCEHETHCGFSDQEPWLPIPDSHRRHARNVQENAPGSFLNRLRRFMAWRAERRELRIGNMEFVDLHPDVLAFERRLDSNPATFCAFNLSKDVIEIPVTMGRVGTALSGHGFGGAVRDGNLCLNAWDAYFGSRQ